MSCKEKTIHIFINDFFFKYIVVFLFIANLLLSLCFNRTECVVHNFKSLTKKINKIKTFRN